ncbi:NADPH-dependent FMN reductase [Adhaeretor mobilis]|uniref:NADPH azoreductase n=1 Tax=Adhaeretor mobilis TaxID=1930276 RepID=A0A517MST9_9BACT|nr:NAD(P)H-dependent oxidoreductase [Adhaeretor mobilis]QDS97929.1 NADPH azoreductase [Adhaeretor mobilis]
MTKILAFAGSARRESCNKQLVKFAAERARQQGADVTLIDLRDFEMPLYHGDLEESEGQPEAATRLFDLMKQHKGYLIACPEYNSSITPLLKNTIDWLSRPREGEPHMAAFAGKVAALLSASPGGLGGIRGLVTVRSILGNIGVHVVPKQFALSGANDAFDESGTLKDDKAVKQVDGVVKQLVITTAKLGES